MSVSSREDVSITTGTDRYLGCCLMRSSTSSPSILGSLRSSRTTAGGPGSRPAKAPCEKMWSSASTPSRTTTISLASLVRFSAAKVSSTSAGLSSTMRIGLSVGMAPSFLAFGQREGKSRALADGALGLERAAVAIDDALGQRQPDPRTFEIFLPVQPLEHLEQLAGVGHVEAEAIVLDGVDDIAVALHAADADPRRRHAAAVFDGVVDQIVERLPDQAGI